MRIVCDISPLALPPTGIGGYIRGLVRELPSVEAGDEVIALGVGTPVEARAMARHLGSPTRVAVKLRPLPRARRLINRLPLPLLELLAGRADAFVSSEWLYPRQRHGLRVAVVHDLIPLLHPEWVSSPTRRMHLAKLADIERSDLVVCNSPGTADAVAERLGVDRARLVVARPGIDERFHSAIASPPRALAGRPYVAALATREPRKNLAALIDAFALLHEQAPELALVLIGAGGTDDRLVSERIAARRVGDAVLETGYMLDTDVPGVLAAARAFAFPSRFEGFGMPIAEAQACGVPVVAGDDPSLDDVAGEAALRADPSSRDAFATQLLVAVRDEVRRSTLIAAGRARSADLSWRATAFAVRRAVGCGR